MEPFDKYIYYLLKNSFVIFLNFVKLIKVLAILFIIKLYAQNNIYRLSFAIYYLEDIMDLHC